MTFIEESEPTFSTEPSSSAIRALPFVWVLTTSIQSTAVLFEALMFLWPRAMLTAGIMRETSPARCPAVCGEASAPPGRQSSRAKKSAEGQARGDVVFIVDLLEAFLVPYSCYWRRRTLSI